MKSYIFKTLLFGLALTGTVACSDDLNKADYDKPAAKADILPTVTTGDVVVSGVAAKATIDLQIPEGANVLKEGIIYTNVEDASLADPRVHFVDFSKVKEGKQIAALTGLSAGETYYVKAYAYVEGQMVYGETKTIKATDDYDYATDIYIDFTDPSLLTPFTSAAWGQSRQKFELVSLANIFGAGAAYVNTVFEHEMMFGQGQAAFASNADEGVLTYELDLKDKNFARVNITAFNLCALFGADGYPTCPGNFDVYASEAPITSAEDLANADKIGSCTFSTDPTESTFQLNQINCSIPASYSDKVYVSIYNKSIKATNNGNMGVAIMEFSVESLHQKTDSAE